MNRTSIESVILCHFPLSADNYKYYSWKMAVTRVWEKRLTWCMWERGRDFWTERLWQLTKFMNIISFNEWTASAAAMAARMYPAHLNAQATLGRFRKKDTPTIFIGYENMIDKLWRKRRCEHVGIFLLVLREFIKFISKY